IFDGWLADRADGSRLQVADDRGEIVHGRGVERVVDLVAVPPSRDDPGLPQGLQVLADCRLAHVEDLGEVARARATGLLREPERDAEPNRMAEGLEAGSSFH